MDNDIKWVHEYTYDNSEIQIWKLNFHDEYFIKVLAMENHVVATLHSIKYPLVVGSPDDVIGAYTMNREICAENKPRTLDKILKWARGVILDQIIHYSAICNAITEYQENIANKDITEI